YHCCYQAGLHFPIKYPDPVPCRFAGVNAWLVWSQLPETGFFHPASDPTFAPQRGDLVIYDNIVNNGPHDHIGIVLHRHGQTIQTAEGNIDNRSGIFQRSRKENVNGYIRIPDRYLPPGP
ncbi:MAG: CHAP domain-containing protein, partial [Chloroflexi bacterium]